MYGASEQSPGTLLIDSFMALRYNTGIDYSDRRGPAMPGQARKPVAADCCMWIEGGKPMNNQGKGSGLMLVVILVVAILIALLAVKQFTSLRGSNTAQQETRQDPVQQAQDAVNALNDRMGQYDAGN